MYIYIYIHIIDAFIIVYNTIMFHGTPCIFGYVSSPAVAGAALIRGFDSHRGMREGSQAGARGAGAAAGRMRMGISLFNGNTIGKP